MPTQVETRTADERGTKALSAAAVVPAYNEESTIGSVVDALRGCKLVSDVIVVSDGSEDATAQVARRHGARVIELPVNMGKGAAMRVGLRATEADVVLFLDADLVGLTPRHVEELLRPVLAGYVDMTVGVFEGGRALTDLAQQIVPQLSGQRAVRRELLLELGEDLGYAGYGVEVALTRYLRRSGRTAQEVVLRQVTHRTKEEKLGLVKGLAARMRMYWEIVRYLP
jgi:glycosyltransferase involved in cell wall biosynthesis